MERMKHLFLAVPPARMAEAGGWGRPLAHMAYRVGETRLYRVNSPAVPRGGLMVAEGGPFRGDVGALCGEVTRECALRKFTGVVCRFRGRDRAALEEVVRRLGEVCRDRGLALYVTEPYGAAAPGGVVLLPTALSGGSLKDRLEEAVGRFGEGRVALWVDRSAEDFSLPAPTGSGRPLTREELTRLREERGANVFFSKELCAHYFTYMAGDRGHFVLCDDAGSVGHKLRLARELGIDTAFLPFETTRDLLGELLEK